MHGAPAAARRSRSQAWMAFSRSDDGEPESDTTIRPGHGWARYRVGGGCPSRRRNVMKPCVGS